MTTTATLERNRTSTVVVADAQPEPVAPKAPVTAKRPATKRKRRVIDTTKASTSIDYLGILRDSSMMKDGGGVRVDFRKACTKLADMLAIPKGDTLPKTELTKLRDAEGDLLKALQVSQHGQRLVSQRLTPAFVKGHGDCKVGCVMDTNAVTTGVEKTPREQCHWLLQKANEAIIAAKEIRDGLRDKATKYEREACAERWGKKLSQARKANNRAILIAKHYGLHFIKPVTVPNWNVE